VSLANKGSDDRSQGLVQCDFEFGRFIKWLLDAWRHTHKNNFSMPCFVYCDFDFASLWFPLDKHCLFDSIWQLCKYSNFTYASCWAETTQGSAQALMVQLHTHTNIMLKGAYSVMVISNIGQLTLIQIQCKNQM